MTRGRFDDQSARLKASVLLGSVGALWLVRVVDSLLPGRVSAAGHGVIPRTIDGLWAIPVAPLIHGDWEHLVSNSVPLLILGALVVLRGVTEFVFVAGVSIFCSGFGTWLFGTGNAQHVGASGVVFGLFGYLLFRSAFDRRVTSALVTVAVAAGYGTAMGFGLVPQEGISWSGHAFGFAGGFVAARLRYPDAPRRSAPAGPPALH